MLRCIIVGVGARGAAAEVDEFDGVKVGSFKSILDRLARMSSAGEEMEDRRSERVHCASSTSADEKGPGYQEAGA